jgi:hypothetical protein
LGHSTGPQEEGEEEEEREIETETGWDRAWRRGRRRGDGQREGKRREKEGKRKEREWGEMERDDGERERRGESHVRERGRWREGEKREGDSSHSGLYWEVEEPVSNQVSIVVFVGAMPSQILTGPEVWGSKFMMSSDGWCPVREGNAQKVHPVSSSFAY